ncbi:hypothetical protein F2P56_018418 [Juglans regia]|uniref:Uncharacterized protein n=1 Tax=Juglans regia TaxID=51240 RepID=A0A833X6Q3_JUGRE|nr:hypothetical protein F2P56_018418 [Juglans regia]
MYLTPSCSGMDNIFSFPPSNFDAVQESFGYPEDLEIEELPTFKEKQDHLAEMEVGEANPLISSQYGFHHQEDMAKKVAAYLLKGQRQHSQNPQPYRLTDLMLDAVSPQTQPTQVSAGLARIPETGPDFPEQDKQIPHPFSLASLKLLTDYGSGFKKLKGERLSDESTESTCVASCRLSTEEIMRVAGGRYIQFRHQMYDDYYMPTHSFGFALPGDLSEDEKRDVELAHLLLAAAEEVGFQQYDHASRLLSRSEWISSARGNPVQRVVYQFSEALRERIEKESGREIHTKRGLEEKDDHQGLSRNHAYLTTYQ